MTEVAYFDSSAIVKLVVAEPESAALVAFMKLRSHLATSSIAIVEVSRAVARQGHIDPAVAAGVLVAFTLIELTDSVRLRAAALPPPDLRTLDAIHLASALELGADLAAFLTYDDRLARAARSAGLRIEAPSAS